MTLLIIKINAMIEARSLCEKDMNYATREYAKSERERKRERG